MALNWSTEARKGGNTKGGKGIMVNNREMG